MLESPAIPERDQIPVTMTKVAPSFLERGAAASHDSAHLAVFEQRTIFCPVKRRLHRLCTRGASTALPSNSEGWRRSRMLVLPISTTSTTFSRPRTRRRDPCTRHCTARTEDCMSRCWRTLAWERVNPTRLGWLPSRASLTSARPGNNGQAREHATFSLQFFHSVFSPMTFNRHHRLLR